MMEKTLSNAKEPLFYEAKPAHSQGRPRRSKARFLVLLPIFALHLILSKPLWLFPSILHRNGGRRYPVCPPSNGDPKPVTSWDDIVPSEKLSWTPCLPAYGPGFYCARLTVPMDYNRPLSASPSNPRVHIAMVLVPGLNHNVGEGILSESPLLINPGGPGGSGTSMVLRAGPSIQQVVGAHHDVIGFDPRGIGATWPQADCFDPAAVGEPEDGLEKHEALMHRLTWTLGGAAIGLPNSTQRALGDIVRREGAMNRLCAAKDGEDSIFRHVGTPNVAQDMKGIVAAWDEWLEGLRDAGEARAPDGGPRNPSAVATYSPPDTKGKLVYWGFSYGTILGATFAAMFPESVGRVVLDGVVAAEYYGKETLLDSLRDTDAVLSNFSYYCHKAKTKCQLYRDGDEIEDIQNRFDFVVTSLENEPLVVISNRPRMPVEVDIHAFKLILFATAYAPISLFPFLASFIDIIYRGLDVSPFIEAPDIAPLCYNGLDVLEYPTDAQRAIWCVDVVNHEPIDGLDDVRSGFEQVANTSYFADVLAGHILPMCSGWKLKPRDPPALEWEKFPWKENPPANTSFPLMFISNTHDPVTPLKQGLIQAGRYVSAGLVEQLSDGHCSLTAVSLCTISKIRAYFDDGVVPDVPEWDREASEDGPMVGKWERCPANQEPFGDPQLLASGSRKGVFWTQQEQVQIAEGVHTIRDVVRRQLTEMFVPSELRNFLGNIEAGAL